MDALSLHRYLEQQAPELEPQLFETHISWVLLVGNQAYKIKKPVEYDFINTLDLETRKKLCEKEVKLNRRTAKCLYRGVTPIFRLDNGDLSFGDGSGEPIDYAVEMKRVDTSLQLDHQLRKGGTVSVGQMESLARRLARFHARAPIVSQQFNLEELEEEFADVLFVESIVESALGKDYAKTLRTIVEHAIEHLWTHAAIFTERVKKGFVRDVHGDLHAGNIFMTAPPLIFDCIEFDDSLRRIDLLSELAFLWLSLDFYKVDNLKGALWDAYQAEMPCMDSYELPVWDFYLMLRANIKLKVNALKLEQANGEQAKAYYRDRCARYFQLLKTYHLRICKWPEKLIN